MKMVLITALGVGGATIIGSLIGFVFKKISHKFSDIVLSFATGVMLSAAVLGLVLPSIEYGGILNLIIVGHVSPEAADGGNIGLIEEGDIIEIDIPNALINVKVSDEVLAERKAKFVASEPNIKTCWLSRYARQVSGADQGAIMK